MDGEIAGVGGGGGGGNAFGNIVVQGQDTVGADPPIDNLEFIPSNNIGITTQRNQRQCDVCFYPSRRQHTITMEQQRCAGCK